MRYTVIDIETDGLIHQMTKMYILGYSIWDDLTFVKKGYITDYDEARTFLEEQEHIVGHNFIRFDKPALQILLKMKLNVKIIDTLALSWYLYPYGSSFRHGLGAWGERLGFGKTVVEDEEWKNLSPELAIERVMGDVEINVRLFHKQMNYLHGLYGNDYMPLINYLGFKMDCLAEQEAIGITLNIRSCETEKHNLDFIIQEKVLVLSKMMPATVDKEAPKVMYKKDGTLSSHGKKWLVKLEEHGLDPMALVITKPGNPGSHSQLKEWLLTLGWVPQTFTVSKATKKEIAQVSLPHGAGICPSVQALYMQYPDVEQLEGLFVARHRYGLFKSFLESEAKRGNGKVYATAHGFTNTLRFTHAKPIVNLPGVDKFYGKELRGALMVPDDSYTMIGSDVSGLEDRTKMHWMFFFDPEYVKQMQTPGFDGHTNIAVFAAMMSKQEEKLYKRITKEKEEIEAEGGVYAFKFDEEAIYYHLVAVRKKAKPVNFGGQYGIGPEKLAIQLNISLAEATALHTAYWELNKAVKQVAADAKTKIVNDQAWLYNPISRLWYFLKADKDKFSTLNQGSGVYVFDTWVNKARQKGVKMVMQYHDEVLTIVKNEDAVKTSKALKDAMKEANEQLRLNVKVGISVDIGKNYSETH